MQIFWRHLYSVGTKKRPRIPTNEGRKGKAFRFATTFSIARSGRWNYLFFKLLYQIIPSIIFSNAFSIPIITIAIPIPVHFKSNKL